MLDLVLGFTAACGYGALIAAYIAVRPKGVLSVMDMFALLFSMQFGPHAILKHPFLESALWVPDIYPAYATGLALAYFGLAGGLYISGSIFKTRSLRLHPFTGRDITSRDVPVLLAISLAYVALFVAFQGFDLSRTISYLNFFSGDTTFTYTELRRDLYSEDSVLGLTAVTRQTSSALIYGALVYAAVKFRVWRIPLIGAALLLFIVCCMQMNKFPFLYYILVSVLIVYMSKCYDSGSFLSRKVVIRGIVALASILALLGVLYRLQYGSEIATGVVTGDRILFRVITRPFSANHDVLYLWFANFPGTYPFVGFANIPIIADAFGLGYFGPTTRIPDLYERVKTTYQAGYIGSAYASFGYLGVLLYSTFVGALVAALARYERRIDVRWQRIVFFSVVGMNCYFLVSRELHTALQSGGLALAPLFLMGFRALSSFLRRARFKGRV